MTGSARRTAACLVVAGMVAASVLAATTTASAAAPTYTTALASITNTEVESSTTGQTIVYQTDGDHPLPANFGTGSQGVITTDARLIIIPNASNLRDGLLRPRPQLLADFHLGTRARCESNPNAVVAGRQQDAEVYTPQEAVAKMTGAHTPTVLFNANYFEIRPQANGTTWLTNVCSSPYGMYYDNHPHVSTTNTAAEGGPYFAGLRGYVKPATGQTVPLDTFFFIDGNTNGTGHRATNSFELVRNTTGDSSVSEANAQLLESQGELFSAFSGTALLPTASTSVIATAPDSGASSTTRTAIGFDQTNDRLLILEGGGYSNGFTRESLAAVMRAAGATIAMELDGGGSSAVAVQQSAVQFRGSATRVMSCNGVTCFSPVTQPTGNARAVPAWVAINVDNF